MASATLKFQLVQNDPPIRVAAWRARFPAAMRSEMDGIGRSMAQYGKANHPWTNRTYEAENRFDAQVTGDTELTVYHGAAHGVFLEFKHGGRWGVIPQTMDHGIAEFEAAMQRAWDRSWS